MKNANGGEYEERQRREIWQPGASAKRVAPGSHKQSDTSPEGAKLRGNISAFQASILLGGSYQGRRASRLPLAVIFRAVGAFEICAIGAW